MARQQTGDDHAGFNTIRIPKEAFLPVIWSLIVTSFIFLPIRFWTRWRAFQRFYWDDALTVLAWLLAVGLGGIACWMKEGTYIVMEALQQAGDVSKVEGIDYWMVRRLALGSVLSFLVFYPLLWSIKLSFLLFFYRLGVKSIPKLNWHWWIVTGITIFAFIACYPPLPYHCTLGGMDAYRSDYCNDQQNLSFLSMKVNCGMDVASDVLIMTIPLNILWRSKLPMPQKLALLGVFSLVIVTIVVAIVRATLATAGVTRQMDVPWVMVWTSLEANIAIIVACVGSFRMLFVKHRKESRPSRESFTMMEDPPLGNRSWRCTLETNGTIASVWAVEEINTIGPGNNTSMMTSDLHVYADGYAEWRSAGEEKNWKDGRYLRSGPITEKDL
ncbi:hypothetical protein P280DRAFT_513085 [Massarina eburnea CBS 473.64]|uniref:Rhodopsin domain-containing protein n=1 Tax=Massarina eburnea CBS 473.64 TaxID=1395130 RepID=A0A6A6SL95_9PLEO|nr:hypothetical protein P280DRAFT_513085 [Massarina eburnea CBS 473.64]